MAEWLQKCLSCLHSYHKQEDAETLYCRCRNGICNYKPAQKKRRCDMPEYDKLVEVKTDIFGGGWKPAIFIRTEWGTDAFILFGFIHVSVDMVKEWRYI